MASLPARVLSRLTIYGITSRRSFSVVAMGKENNGGSRGQELNWSALVSASIHPTKVAILEAIDWLGRPTSPVELDKMLGDDLRLSDVAYHMKSLLKLGAVEKINDRPVRGARETFYYF